MADCRFRTEGKVRVMQPEFGMGVEFASKTLEHRRLLEAVIRRLTLSHDPRPEVLVEPEGLDWGDSVEARSEDFTPFHSMGTGGAGRSSTGAGPYWSPAASGAVFGGTGEAASSLSRPLHGQLASIAGQGLYRSSNSLCAIPAASGSSSNCEKAFPLARSRFSYLIHAPR